jgi:hypothetical protein
MLTLERAETVDDAIESHAAAAAAAAAGGGAAPPANPAPPRANADGAEMASLRRRPERSAVCETEDWAWAKRAETSVRWAAREASPRARTWARTSGVILVSWIVEMRSSHGVVEDVVEAEEEDILGSRGKVLGGEERGFNVGKSVLSRGRTVRAAAALLRWWSRSVLSVTSRRADVWVGKQTRESDLGDLRTKRNPSHFSLSRLHPLPHSRGSTRRR